MPTIQNSNNATKQEISGVVGSTYNTANYASIQAAIDAAEAAGGGTVYVPMGVHSITSRLNVDIGGIGIYLEAGAILQATSSLTNPIINITASNVTISGPGKVDGNGQVSTGGIQAIGTISNINIRDVEVTDTTTDAIILKGTDVSNRLTNSTVKDVYVHDCFEGILLWYANDCQIIGCRAIDMNVGSAQDCIEVSDCFRVIILGCVAKNSGPGNSCFDIYNACEDIIVQGCQALQDIAIASTPAIQVNSAGTGGKRISIIGNLIKGYVTTTQGATAVGVGLDTKSFETGILCSKATDIMIRGNTIVGCCNTTTSYGINISASTLSVTVSDNFVVQTGSGSILIAGATAQTVRLLGNVFGNSHWDTNATATGVINIGTAQPGEWIIDGNHFFNDNTTLDALYYIQAGSGTYSNGTIKNNTSDGGLAAGGSNNPLWVQTSGNYFADNKFYDQNRVGTVQPYSQNTGTTGALSAA